MKVCMVVHAYYEKDARVRAYTASLVHAGHQVDVLSLRDSEHPREYEDGGVRVRGISLRRRRGSPASYIFEYASSLTRFASILALRSLTGRRYDLIHVHNFPNAIVFTALLPKLLGARLLLDVHDPWPELFQSKFGKTSDHWMVRILMIEERLSCLFADHIIAASHLFRKILLNRRVPADKISVVMNAPRREFFRPFEAAGRDDSDFNVLYVGTLAPRYGLPFLFAAVGQIMQKELIPGIRLTIIPKLDDEGTYVQDLTALASEHGLEGRFEIIKPVPHEEMPAIIERCHVSAYTPEPDVHMDKAISLKIPEVLAVGRPVVASRLTVLEHYFGDDAIFMFRPGDVDDLVAKLVEVRSQPNKVAAKLIRAREVLHELGWKRQQAKYLDLVGTIVDCGEPTRPDSQPSRKMVVKKRARRAVVALSTATGPPWRHIRGQRKSGLRVLGYHNIEIEPSNSFSVSVSGFRRQMKCLCESYSVVPLVDGVKLMRAGPSDLLIAITFDDGFQGVLDFALPILEEYGLPATCFFVGSLPGADTRFMDWEGARRLCESGLVTAGSHTMTHRGLQLLDDDELAWELSGSKTWLEQRIGQEIDFLAYPYGTPRHFNSKGKNAVATAGYRAAFTAVNGLNTARSDLFALRRTKIEWGDSIETFERMLRGAIDVWKVADYLLALKKRRKEVDFSTFDSTGPDSGSYS